MKNYPLYTIDKTITFIKAKGISVPNIDTLDLDDTKTYDLLTEGNTHGIFQFQRSDDKTYLRYSKLRTFSDLTAFIAFNRPGPVGNNMMHDFIDKKNGTNHFEFTDRKKHREVITYNAPALESILSESYGLIIYREQIVEIAVKIAGFPDEQGKLFLKNLLQKNHEEMRTDKNRFVTGLKSNGIPMEKAVQIYDHIEYQSGFVARKSYIEQEALLTYKMAYLKANFPDEFMDAVKFENSYDSKTNLL